MNSSAPAPGPVTVPAPPDPGSRPPLRVTQISTTDIIGGAARAMQRLHLGLGAAGVQSRLLVAQRFGPADPTVEEYNAFAPAPRALNRFLFRLSRRWSHPKAKSTAAYLSPDWTFTGWRLPSRLQASDVLNLHWVTDLLDFRTLPALARRHPLVWTLHDMNAFTGGCHYTGTCERFQGTCGHCPQLAHSTGENDLTNRVILRKKSALHSVDPARLTIVTPSHWLAQNVARSALLRNFPTRVIPNGLDSDEYKPMPRADARRQLGLPPDARILLFVAESLADPRKGFDLLCQALEAVNEVPNVLLVTLGRGHSAAIGGLPTRHLGSLDDAASLRAAYAAADVFALPSLQDNLPNTLLESMACGTPVVGFSIGGVGEAIVDGQTGLLAPAGDTTAFGRALRRILEDAPLRGRLSAGARERALREYDVRLQAARYAALYGSLAPA